LKHCFDTVSLVFSAIFVEKTSDIARTKTKHLSTMKAFTINPSLEMGVSNGIRVITNAFGKFGLNLGGVKFMPIKGMTLEDVVKGHVMDIHPWINDGTFLELNRQNTDPEKMAKSDTRGIVVAIKDTGFLDFPILGRRQWLQSTYKIKGDEVLAILLFNEEGVLAFQVKNEFYIASRETPGLLVELSHAEFSVIQKKSAGGKNDKRTLSRQVASYLKKRVETDKVKAEGTLAPAMKKALQGSSSKRGASREEQLGNIAEDLLTSPAAKSNQPVGEFGSKLADALKDKKGPAGDVKLRKVKAAA
jgi:hypothetical protein